MVIIAAVLVAVSLSAAIYGQELARVVRTFTLGNKVEYAVVEDLRNAVPIPTEVKGQVFDALGNELETFPEDHVLYDAYGREINLIFDDGKARIMTDEEFQSTQLPEEVMFYDLKECKSYFICEALTPGYLPEGYTFSKAGFYGNPLNDNALEKGADKFMNIYYSNDADEMVVSLRYIDDPNTFGRGVSTDVEELNINGHDAILDKNRIDIQINDVLYTLSGNETLGRDELVKIAGSLE